MHWICVNSIEIWLHKDLKYSSTLRPLSGQQGNKAKHGCPTVQHLCGRGKWAIALGRRRHTTEHGDLRKTTIC